VIFEIFIRSLSPPTLVSRKGMLSEKDPIEFKDPDFASI
jgi:hypothetical protein